ncbi:MAG: 2-oxoacid:acceptor oxidoreductase subunit alpha [Planctomycetota bacterium]
MYLQGNQACVLGALKAGCRFYAGYPITPSSEIMEEMAKTLPKYPCPAEGGACPDSVGNGVFVQMEDEIGSLAAVIGAVWAGAKAMTATSGPGLALMLENIGYAVMTETPCVIVNVQRAGPSTGQATKPASGDVMSVRWGAPGDYEIIAFSPWSVQEMYEFTIKAFNLAETYRVPVFLLADEAVGHLKETVELKEDIPVIPRAGKSETPPFSNAANNLPSPMPMFGQGRKLSVTGSTHDEWGYRRTQAPEAHAVLINRFCDKIRKNAEKIVEWETYESEDAEILVVAYGFTARSALRAVRLAREKGIKAGLLRLKTLWPFPEKIFQEMTPSVKKIIVPEMNQGQLIREIQSALGGLIRCEVIPYHKTNGQVITPDEILALLTTKSTKNTKDYE